MQRSFLLTIVGILLAFSLFSQKKPLDHSVYDSWESLSATSLSNDGRMMATLIAPQEGDSTLFLKDLTNNRSLTMERVTRFTLSPDGAWTVGLLRAPFSERRQARIDKKKADEMPDDSLLIIHNHTFEVKKIANVRSFKTAEKAVTHIAYTTTLPEDTTKEGAKKEKKKEQNRIVAHAGIPQHQQSGSPRNQKPKPKRGHTEWGCASTEGQVKFANTQHID